MFKFNFNQSAAEEPAQPPTENAQMPSPADAEEVSASEARCIALHDVIRIGNDIALLKGQVSNEQAARLLGQAEAADSDLLPGQYEGGFKVWEGSVDLAELVSRLWAEAGGQAASAAAAAATAAGAPVEAAGDTSGPAGGEVQAAGEALCGRLLGQRVIELGCGHALPGLVALLAGAEVHFQDYNKEVLQTVTIPNVEANWGAWQFKGGSLASRTAAAPAAAAAAAPTAAAAAAPAAAAAAPAAAAAAAAAAADVGVVPCSGSGHSSGKEGAAEAEVAAAASAAVPAPARYYSGDWGALGPLLQQQGLAGAYDFVLSAETIYSLDSMRNLYGCIKQCLRRPGGVAYVAAKTFYFGVGGGTAAFVKMVNAEGLLRAEVVQVLDDGRSNKREIIRLAWS